MTLVTIVDKNYCVWGSFFALGFCSLLPWNMLLNAIPWFDNKFNMTDTSVSFAPLATISAMVPLMFITCLTPIILFMFSPVKKMGMGLCGMFVLSICMLFALQTTKYLYITAVTVIVLISGCFSLFQSSLFATASNFPMAYMTPIIVGQGLAGILTAAFTKYLNCKYSLDFATNVNFIVGTLITTITCYIYWSLFYNNFFLFYTETITPEKSPKELVKSSSFTSMTWVYFVTIWLINTSTLAVFPGVIFDINVNGAKLVPCILFCYGVFDLIGRISVCAFPSFGKDPFNLLTIVFWRTIIAIAFLFCDISPKQNLPVLFGDVTFFIMLAVFGITSGFVTGLCFMWAPEGNKEENLSLVGYLMTLFLSLGLVVGSVIAIPLRIFI